MMERGRDSYPVDWSHDGKWIMVRTFAPKTGADLWIVPAADTTHAFAYLATPFARRITGGVVYVDGGANLVA